LRHLGSIAVTALFLISSIACSGSGNNGSSSPAASPTGAADTKAADLRTRVNLLFAEHVIVIAKMADAGVGARTDEYASYAALLTTNRDDITSVMVSAFGTSASTDLEPMLSDENEFVAAYIVGDVSHNSTKAAAAFASLTNGFVPRFAQFMSTRTKLSSAVVTQLATDVFIQIRAVVDDAAARSYPRLFADLRSAALPTSRLADAVASSIAGQFPDKFPGSLTDPAVDARVGVSLLLHEHAYLATMVTGALIGARNTEQAAAQAALAANGSALSIALEPRTQFGPIWNAKNAALLAYAGSTDAAKRQAARDQLTGAYVAQLGVLIPGAADAAAVQVEAAIRVIDDQRSNTTTRVAADDRTAAAATEPLAAAMT
jgi:hypothetical protein